MTSSAVDFWKPGRSLLGGVAWAVVGAAGCVLRRVALGVRGRLGVVGELVGAGGWRVGGGRVRWRPGGVAGLLGEGGVVGVLLWVWRRGQRPWSWGQQLVHALAVA